MQGTVEAICIARTAAGPMEPATEIRAIAGEGLEGDRYCGPLGTLSKDDSPKRQCTLIEAEAIEALKREYDIDYAHIDSRRNILTRGVALNHLIEREFTVGIVRMRGKELAEPCGHMEKLCGKDGARKALIHRGGLRCEILNDGEIRVGDVVKV